MDDWQDPETPIYNELMRRRAIVPSESPIYDQLLENYQAQGKLQEEEQMNKMQSAVQEYLTQAGQTVNEAPRIPSEDDMRRASVLLDDAVKGTNEAIAEQDIIGIATGIATILYDAFGAAARFGIDMQPIFDEVHKSMMSGLKAGHNVLPNVGIELNKQSTYGHEDPVVYKTKEIPITLGIGGPKIGLGKIVMEHNGEVMMEGTMDDVSTLPVIDHLGFSVSGLSIGDDIPVTFTDAAVVDMTEHNAVAVKQPLVPDVADIPATTAGGTVINNLNISGPAAQEFYPGTPSFKARLGQLDGMAAPYDR